MLDNVVVGELGVIRWRSNGQIPPEDCLQELEKWISFNRYLSSMIREEGFNSTVQPLSVLKSSDQDLNNLDAAYEVGLISKINNITSRVVGTGEQQWYIHFYLW